MNKKFLSAILFGALVASTGSFVSCADNDDKIDQLQDQNSELKAQLAQLKSELQAELKNAASASQVAAIEAKLSAIEGVTSDNIAATVAALKGNFDTQEARVVALETQIKALEGLKDVDASELIAVLNKAKENGTADMTGLSAMVDALDAQVNTLLTDVRSIVFQPEFYVDGIEAAEYSYLRYVPLCDDGDARVYGQQVSDKLSQADTEYPGGSYVVWNYGKYNSITIKKDFKWAYLHVGDITDVYEHPATYSRTSLETAFYMGSSSSCNADGCTSSSYDWGRGISKLKEAVVVGKNIINTMYFAVNPANTEVKAEDLNVAVKNVMAMTRASVADVTITNVTPVKDGAAASKNEKIVKVEYYISNPLDIITANNDESYSVLNKKENTTIIKLQAATEGGIVESDWAALYETSIQPVAVSLNKKGADAKWNAPINCTGAENVACGENYHDGSHYAKDAADAVYPELHKNPYEALIDDHRTAEIDYRSQGINIAEHIELHFVKRDAEKANRKHADEHSAAGHNNNKKEVLRPHVTMSLAEAAYKFGFTYEFALVPYTTDDNKTNNSAYAHLAEAASMDKATYGTPVIIPNTVEEDPKLVDDQFNLIPKKAVATSTYTSNDGYEQGASSVDRQPLVQVLVKKDGEVILDAYVNFIITRHVGNIIAPLFDLGSKDKSCATLTYAMTWNQVSELLYEQTANKGLGMSKLEFEESYELARYDNGAIMQFDVKENTNIYGEKDYEATPVKYENTYTVVYEDIDVNGTTTSVLKLDLDKFDQQYVYEKENRSDIIYVMYIRKGTAVNSTLNGILVPMQIAINEVKALEYSEKNINFWYDKTGKPNILDSIGINNQSIRLNVNYALDKGDTYTTENGTLNDEKFNGATVQGFVRDLDDAWDGKALKVGDKKVKTQANYYFHPLTKNVVITDEYSGVKYQLDVDSESMYCAIWVMGDDPELYAGVNKHEHLVSDSISKQAPGFVKQAEKDNNVKVTKGIYTNTKLYAYEVGKKATTRTQIAELNGQTGDVHYMYNDMAKKVLNATGHRVAEEYAYFGIYLANECEIAKYINYDAVPENIFAGYWLRPLDIQPCENDTVIDATNNAYYISIFDKYNFTDWRDYKIVDRTKTPMDYKNVWLLAFYGVKYMTLNLDKVTTDMNKHNIKTDLLTSVNQDIKISYVEHNKTSVIGVLGEKATKPVDLKTYNKESMGVKSTYDEIVDHFGYLKYENKGANVSNFKFIVPVTFGYDWGEITTSFEIQVIGTEGNHDGE